MASWFRAAEELFEVVDRRAKQVTDEILVGQNPATEFGVLGRVLATSPLTKGPNAVGKVTAVAHTSTSHANGFKNEIVSPGSLSTASGSIVALPDPTSDSTPTVELDSEPQQREHVELTETERPLSTVKAELPDISVEGGNVSKKDREADNVNPTEASPSLNNIVVNEDDVQESPLEHHESVKCKFGENNSMVTVELVAEKAAEHAKVGLQPANDPVENRGEFSDNFADNPTSSVLQQDSSDAKIKDSAKVEEQLDEAQGLLKIAVSSGQSKEARLARVCAGLSSRLQEYKTENAQLEALLQKERHEKSVFEMQLAQMQSEVALARAASSSVEAEMSAALASKNAEIEALVSSLENVKKQAALSEGKLAALQANMEVMARSRDLTENGMIQTLKEALEAAEHRAEEEHAAHIATRKAAAKRETELEQCVADVTAALTRMQRTLDERTQKATDLEYKVSALEIDCANMNQELQQMEAKLRREQKRAPEEALQLQAWREDADRAREAHREAEGKILALEAENQKLRVELAGVKREADQVSTQAHLELEKRFRDLTEVLYLKQTQLEAMASEKAAAVFQLEKELSKSREAQAEVERHKRIRHSVSGWDDGHEMKTLESLGLQQRPLVGSSIQRAAKLLDSGAVTAGRFLWRRPLARLGVLFYLVFVHVFLLYLLHRLQEQAANFMSSKEEMEAAAAAGLVKLGMQR